VYNSDQRTFFALFILLWMEVIERVLDRGGKVFIKSNIDFV